VEPNAGRAILTSAFSWPRFALWKGGRIGVGRGFRNANHDVMVIGHALTLRAPRSG